MDQTVLTTIIYITIFLLGALAFGIGPIIIVRLLSPTSHTRQTAGRSGQLIECGLVQWAGLQAFVVLAHLGMFGVLRVCQHVRQIGKAVHAATVLGRAGLGGGQ